MLRKGQLNRCDAAAAGSVSDGRRREKFSLLFRVIKNNKEVMSYLCVQKDADVVGSFGICHCKELIENPACRTFLSDPYFSYLGVVFSK